MTSISTNPDTPNNIEIGEHVIAFWADDFGKYQWFLAIVDKIVTSELLLLSYLKRMDITGKDWVFPEESEVRETTLEQILDTKVVVTHYCSTRIRCRISREIIESLDEKHC